jgi:hypothetical protein
MKTKKFLPSPKDASLHFSHPPRKIAVLRLVKTNDKELEEEVYKLNARVRRNMAAKFERWANQLRQTADLLDGRLVLANRN